MFEFISRYCFGKNHEEVKKRSVKEVGKQLANMSDESLSYVAECYEVDVDELIEKNRSIVYITLKKRKNEQH